MARKCKTCTSTLRDEIDLQIMQGASFTYLAKWCCDRGLNITDTALRKHANNHIEGYDPKVFSEVKKAPKVDTIANQLPDPTIVNFQDYLKKINLDIKEAHKRDKHEEHINALKSSVIETYFRLSAILDKKLIDYTEGKTKFPTEQLKALRIFFDVYARVTSVEIAININKAIDTIDYYLGLNIAYRDDDNDNLLIVEDRTNNKIITINTEDKTVSIK